MTDLALLAVGLLGLTAGTEVAVRAAVRLARRFRLSQLFIGLTLLAFGTDLPELVVAVTAALETLAGRESSGIVVGDAVGSAVAQISLVAGIVALLAPIPRGQSRVRDLAVRLGASGAALALVGLDGEVGGAEGALLLLGFAVYLHRVLGEERRLRRRTPVPGAAATGLASVTLALVAGLLLVVFSSDLAVERALAISERFGLRQSLVGALLVGLGTSLPELAISANAALRGRGGLSLGNLVGSNVFDCLVPVGAAALIHPVRFGPVSLLFDMPALAVATAVFVGGLRHGALEKRHGAWLVALYLLYAAGRAALA